MGSTFVNQGTREKTSLMSLTISKLNSYYNIAQGQGGDGNFKLPEFNLSSCDREVRVGGSFGHRMSYKEYYQRYLSKAAWKELRISSNNKFDYYITFSEAGRINCIFFETITWPLNSFPVDKFDMEIFMNDSLNDAEKSFYYWLHHEYLKH